MNKRGKRVFFDPTTKMLSKIKIFYFNLNQNLTHLDIYKIVSQHNDPDPSTPPKKPDPRSIDLRDEAPQNKQKAGCACGN